MISKFNIMNIIISNFLKNRRISLHLYLIIAFQIKINKNIRLFMILIKYIFAVVVMSNIFQDFYLVI